MNRPSLSLTLSLFAALAVLPAAASADDKHAHWTYAGPHGAGHWGELEPEFATCQLGKEQSPIDIRDARKANLAPLAPHYAASDAELVNNGHTVQVNLGAGGTLDVDGTSFKLLQFHFHTPSEERVNGKAYPLVAHLVHKSDSGTLAVVAVLFKAGKPNSALHAVFASLPAHEGEHRALPSGLNLEQLLPADRGYYKFTGSLTTPPCSEGVLWHVLKEPVSVSKAQLAKFRKLYKSNARPVQPLNGRVIEES